MTTDTQHTTPTIGVGRVRKVMSLKTSDEVKQARIRERQKQRLCEVQQVMLTAVVQVVVLPEPLPKPISEPICEQMKTVESYQEPMNGGECVVREQRKSTKVGCLCKLRKKMERALEIVTAFVDRMRVLLLEEV